MKFFMLTLLCVTTFTLGSALRCYLCVGPIDGACAQATKSAMTTQTCKTVREEDLKFSPDHKMSKLNEEYEGRKIVSSCVAVGVQVNGTSVFTRGCGYIYKGVDLCTFLAHHVDKVKSCKTCNKDLCNTM